MPAGGSTSRTRSAGPSSPRPRSCASAVLSTSGGTSRAGTSRPSSTRCCASRTRSRCGSRSSGSGGRRSRTRGRSRRTARRASRRTGCCVAGGDLRRFLAGSATHVEALKVAGRVRGGRRPTRLVGRLTDASAVGRSGRGTRRTPSGGAQSSAASGSSGQFFQPSVLVGVTARRRR